MRQPSLLLRYLAIVIFVTLANATGTASAQTELPSDMRDKIDKLAVETLNKTGVPSASVALVKDGQIVYVKAYGDARIDPRTPATPEMRYSIGSISKQFTAGSIV